MRVFFLGDVVGESGYRVVKSKLPGLISDLSLDFVALNGENSVDGFGITEHKANLFFDLGVDVITTGNHVWDQPGSVKLLSQESRILRPANLSAGSSGKGTGLFIARNGARVLVSNLMGRIFMPSNLEDPFLTVDTILFDCPLKEHTDAIILDFHAEATSEKQCFAHFVDGRASLVVGTHTHVPTADAKILSGATGYISDLGMCGDYDSSLGLEKEEPLKRFLVKEGWTRFKVAEGRGTLCGLAAQISDRTGLTEKISSVRIGPHLQEILPSFW